MERTSRVQGTKPRINKQKTHRAKEVKTSLLFADKDYKGSPARSRRKVQTHCHLRGNLFCLGEERPPIKDTKSLADISAGLRGKHEKQSPDRTGPKGCPSRKPSSGFPSTKDLTGG